MIAKSILLILRSMGMITILIIIGSVITYAIYDKNTTVLFLNSSVFKFNGILVGGFGYGLMFFIISQGKSILVKLINIVDINENNEHYIANQFTKLVSWKRYFLLSFVVFIIGGYFLWNCGYPMDGFPKMYLAFFSCTIYFVASFILFFFISIIIFFMKLDLFSEKVKMKKNFYQIDLNSFNMFFIITSTIGVFAIYLGFRGTLSANFLSDNIFFKKMLILPIFLYLPVTLIYSFYPRYILKKVNDHAIIDRIKELDNIYHKEVSKEKSIKSRLKFEKMLLELKERIYMESKQFPIISIKDSFSIFILIIMLLQFIVSNDPAIKEYVKYLFN